MKLKPLFRRVFTERAADESGSVAVMAVFLLIGAVAAAAFLVDSTRLTADGTRLKQATDAAAQAATTAWSKDRGVDVNEIAERYVFANIGMDKEQLERELRVSVEPYRWKDFDGFQVTVSFRAKPSLLGGSSETVEVSSAAVAIYNPLEVALALPTTMNESAADMRALQNLGEDFFDQVVTDHADRWMALVPFSDTVNVWDETNGEARIRSWAAEGRLAPKWLGLFFKETGITDMSSPRMPNNRKKILHVSRGMNPGEIFKWTEPPQQSFEIRTSGDGNDIAANYPAGWPIVSWTGYLLPPDGTGTSGPMDQRHMAADWTVPLTPLLPLTDERQKFRNQLSRMVKDHAEITHAISMNLALGWSAMALSPGFRGNTGWGDLEHPLDFTNEDTTNVKAVVMLVNLEGPLADIDSDSNNDNQDTSLGNHASHDAGRPFLAQRVNDLCRSMKKHDVYFYMVVIEGRESYYGKEAWKDLGPSFEVCTRSGSDISLLRGSGFASAEGDAREKLNQIAQSLESISSYVRLVK